MDNNFLSPHEIQHRFMHINRLHRCAVDTRISETGIHRSQHMTLMYLNRCDSKVSQKTIADHFEISPAAVAVSLKRLESEGYIRRNSSQDDNRYNETEITEKGKEVVDFSCKVFDSVDQKTFEGISEEEKQTLCGILDKIILNLRQITGKDDINE